MKLLVVELVRIDYHIMTRSGQAYPPEIMFIFQAYLTVLCSICI